MKRETTIIAAALRLPALFIFGALILVGANPAANGQTPTPTPTPAWIQSGANIRNANPGNVGVGTSSPASIFSVNLSNADYTNTGGGGSHFLMTNPNASGQNVITSMINGVTIAKWRTDYAGNNSWVAGLTGKHDFYTGGDFPTGIVRMTILNNGNVGVGTASPQTTFNINQVAGASKGLLISGDEYYQSGNSGANGVLLLLGVNRPGNRQLWIGDNSTLGSATSGFLRFQTGTALPMLDGVTGNGQTRLPISLGTVTTNVGVGFGESLTGSPGSKLSVAGGAAVGVNYRSAASPANGVIIEGNVGIGTASPTAKLEVAGNINAVGNITATGNIAAKYQDVAEWVPSAQKLSAGMVVVLDTARTNHVAASGAAYDTAVAGVVSAQPGVILGEGGEGKVMVATTGRVKVRVDASRGAIRVGDLLVTSGAEGVAMKSVPLDLGGVKLHRPGTIIGKALEPLEKGTGEILVLLSLQ